jgi:hypothetical protein
MQGGYFYMEALPEEIFFSILEKALLGCVTFCTQNHFWAHPRRCGGVGLSGRRSSLQSLALLRLADVY